MIKFDISQLVPRFLMEDKNGYALAKAIETALRIMDETVEAGIRCISSIDDMPEWRLDEMAWEYACLYDYDGDIQSKRKWIKTAISNYRILGTAQFIVRYMESLFDEVWVEEGSAYEAEPFHFRVVATGEGWTGAKEAWVHKAALAAKNVRSIFDGVMIGSQREILISHETMAVPMEFTPCGTMNCGE